MKKSIFLFFAAILCAIGMNATNLTGGEVVLLKPSTNWKKDGARFAVYFFNDAQGKNTWVSMTKASDETDIYYAVAPTGNWEKLIFCRMNPGASANGWGNKWNQSGNCTWTNTKSLLTVGSSWDSFTGTWSAKVVTSKGKLVASSANVSENEAVTLTPSLTTNTAINTILSTEYTISPATGASVSGNTFTATAAGEYTITATIKYRLNGYASTSFESTATATTTITVASAAEPKHDVKVTWTDGTKELQSSQTLSVGESTGYPVEAPEFKDYTFSGWTLGSGVQSADENANPISITTKASGEYTLVANYDYIEPVIKTIYCKMEHGWWTGSDAAISAYASGTEGEMKSGLGTLMTLAPWESTVWKLDVDIARYQKVQFIRVSKDGLSDWNARTAVLDIPTDTKDLYTITQSTDMWYNGSYTCSGTWSTYTPAAVPDRYLTGNAAGFGMTIDGEGNEQWSPNTIKMTWNDATQKFTHTVSGLEANKYYKFRITDGTWDGKWGYSNLKSAIENVFEAEDNNISFVLAADGDLTITFDGTYIELTTTSSFAAPVYTIVGDGLLMGTHWDLNSVENQMKHSAGNIYTLEKTVRIPAGEYEYKAVRNYSYDWEVPNNGGKNKVTIEKSGEGTIIYTLDVDQYTLKHEIKNWEEKDLSNTVELYGIGENKTFIEAADHKTTSVDVVLEANKVYSFEVVVNSVYMKNTGVMWRGNCEGWTFTPEGSRAHIITDLAGTYTFTWTYEGNKLSVKYPDGTNVPAPIFLAGKMNNWERLATRLIPSADGKTASAKVELERNVYNEFRMVIGTEDWTNTGTMDRGNCTGWTFDKVTEGNKDVNAGIIPDATGEYIFTWSYTDNKLSVTYPEQTCTDCSAWYLCGSFNDWKLSNEFTKTATADVVEATLTLEAGTYTFKVQDMTDPTDGKWYGNNATMERNSTGLATGWTFATDKDHCTIVADIAGDYIFTWNTDTKKLTVQYPTPTITLTTGDNSTVINANIGKTVNVKIERSFTANDGYYTLCVPFEMQASVIGTVYEISDLEKYETGKDGGLYIKLSQVTTLSAGVPYLVEPKENMDELLVKNVIIAEDDESSYTRSNAELMVGFCGSYSAGGKTNGSTEYYVGDGGLLYNNSVDKRGLCGYFVITDNNGDPVKVRARVVAGENVETGVDNIVTTDAPVKAIVNGQLIIIRDGVKYNIQGQKL